MSLILGKFKAAPGYDNEKHIYMGPQGLVIEYYFNQDGYYEAIVIRQSGNIYIMDSNINGALKRTTFTWNDLYAYLQSDFRLKFAFDFINSQYYTYGTKRVLSRTKPGRRTSKTRRGSKTRRDSKTRRGSKTRPGSKTR